MSETMHKADWRARVCRAVGVLVLLVGVLFAAGLCVADTPHDSPVSGGMNSTLSDPAFWSRFQFGFTLVYHYLFPQLTMGLGWFLVYWKWRAIKTGAVGAAPQAQPSGRTPDASSCYGDDEQMTE
jgi:hypothetical protein